MSRTRYTLVVEYELLDGEVAVMPEDIEADAMHGGLHNYYGVSVVSARGPEPVDADLMADPRAITSSDLKTMVMQEDDDA